MKSVCLKANFDSILNIKHILSNYFVWLVSLSSFYLLFLPKSSFINKSIFYFIHLPYISLHLSNYLSIYLVAEISSNFKFNEDHLRKSLKTILTYAEKDNELSDSFNSFPEQVQV